MLKWMIKLHREKKNYQASKKIHLCGLKKPIQKLSIFQFLVWNFVQKLKICVLVGTKNNAKKWDIFDDF